MAQAYATAGRERESHAAAQRAAAGDHLAGFEDPIHFEHVVGSGVSSARRFERALHALAADDLDAAREHVEAILEYREDQADAFYLIGLIEARSGDVGEAGRQLQRALELDPDHLRSLLELSALAESAGRLEDAKGWIERALVLTPRDPSVARRLVRNRYLADDIEGVVRAMERLVELQPDIAVIHIDLADLYAHQERWADAEQHYRAAGRLATAGSDEARYAAERLKTIPTAPTSLSRPSER